jgi:hypothetical protein
LNDIEKIRHREYQKQWRLANPEKARAYQKKWRDGPKRRGYIKKWEENNKDKRKIYQKRYYDKNPKKRSKDSSDRIKIKRQMLTDIKLKNGCSICGYNRCAAALHFHHTGDDKEILLSHPHASIETLLAEVEKCMVVCANCHAELHANMKIMEKVS